MKIIVVAGNYQRRAANTKAPVVINTRSTKAVECASEVLPVGVLMFEVEVLVDVVEVVTLVKPLVVEVVALAVLVVETEPEPEGAAVPETGASTAVEGSTRFPIPQGIGSFEPG